MYTRQTPREDGEIRIPENYRGNAFGGDSLTPIPPIEQPMEQTEEVQTLPAVSSPKEEITVAATPKKAFPFSSLLPPRPASPHGGLLGDIDWEDLLILGILLLVWQSESDRDVLLLLALLLFYK